ncbi:MAG: hypothetical protein J6Y02_23460 [Pseudobutyrivibrio sp.]|nr:hypothetical protein [Pseudobutyrivibrio sp.]
MAEKRVTKKDAEVMKSQAEQMAVSNQAMEDIAAIEQQTQMLQQEAQNKAHDTEFSAYSDYNGQNPMQENLGVIGEEEVKEAYQTLLDYKKNKAELEKRLENAEKCWLMQHWDIEPDNPGAKSNKNSQRIKPKSAWLVNTILNKHADAMDNYPEPNILPRAADDEQVAKVLTEVIPVILEQNEYQKTYSDCAWDKNKFGTSIQGIYWNNDKNNGLGDIDIKCIDINQLYWKSGVTDIQDSPNVFHVSYMDNDEIKARYPDLKDVGTLGTDATFKLMHYGQDVDETNQTAVFDWYYKRRIKTVNGLGVPTMKTVVHYVKFTNDKVLYASENDPQYAQTGWYAHGLYPFVFDVLFPVKANACGMGYIDLIMDDQMYIDKLQQAILENAIAGARPRKAFRKDAGINKEDFMDIENPYIEYEGRLDDGSVLDLTSTPLNGIYEQVYLQKIQEMKDTSGNTAASQGQTSNVTTASGIASLQEAAGKLSRDSSQESYRAFKMVCYQVIELIRQFYTVERCFRISGETGKNEFVTLDNSQLQPQQQAMLALPDGGMLDLGKREPVLDIEVRPQKKSAYSKETQNQTALNLYQMGFFAPGNGDASLACLDMMDFDGVEKIKEKVQMNATLFMQVQQLSAIVAQVAPELAMQMGIINGAAAMANQPTGRATTGTGTRGSLSKQAAQATSESTAVRS